MFISPRAARPLAALVGSLLFAAPATALAQDSTAAPAVGQTAPDFSAPGATRYGLLREPVKLSDFRGKTVVLAFFYKARTKG